MKLQIEADVLFSFSEKPDLFLQLHVEKDEFFTQKLTLEDVLKKSIRGLNPAEKRDAKKVIAAKFRKFLETLEK